MGLTTPGLSGPWYVMAIDRVKHLIMPVAAMSLRGIGSWMRYQRSSYLEVMNQDYMRTARSKGLDEDHHLDPRFQERLYTHLPDRRDTP